MALSVKGTRAIIGENLRVLREQKGYTQAGLAKLIGYTQQGLSLIENAERDLPASSLWTICRALGCEPNDILFERKGG